MVYVLDGLLSITSGQMVQAKSLVTQQRREQAERCRFESDRVQSIFSFLLLQYGIKEVYGIEEELHLDYCGGKPALMGKHMPHFNLSHCKLSAACALSDRPVGVDVQDWNQRHLAVARRACTPEELALVEGASDPVVEFAKLWTRKESYGKFTGQGICYPLKEENLANRSPAGTVMETFLFDGYALSYCAKEKMGIRRVTVDDLLCGRKNK